MSPEGVTEMGRNEGSKAYLQLQDQEGRPDSGAILQINMISSLENPLFVSWTAYSPLNVHKLLLLYESQSPRGTHECLETSSMADSPQMKKVQSRGIDPARFWKIPGFWDQHGAVALSFERTKVLRISFLRGLFEANTTRFPYNFFIIGVWSAWGRTGCFGDMVLNFAQKQRQRSINKFKRTGVYIVTWVMCRGARASSLLNLPLRWTLLNLEPIGKCFPGLSLSRIHMTWRSMDHELSASLE